MSHAAECKEKESTFFPGEGTIFGLLVPKRCINVARFSLQSFSLPVYWISQMIGIARGEWIESLIGYVSKLQQDFSAVTVAFMFINSKEQRALTKIIVLEISYSTHVVIIIIALQNYWYFYRESKHRYLERNF